MSNLGVVNGLGSVTSLPRQSTVLWFLTLALMTSTPSPGSTSVVAWQWETGRAYLWVPGDTTTADGVTVVQPTTGVAGRWILGDTSIVIQPRGSGLDDAARFKTFADACAPAGVTINMAEGTWTWATSQNLISALRLKVRGAGQDKTIITSTMAPLDGHTNSVFFIDGNATGSNATTLNGGIAIGATTALATNGAAVPNNSEVLFIEGANVVVGSYRVGVAVNTLTLDRRLRRPFANGTVVRLVTFARNYEISDLTITGTGDRAIQLCIGRECVIRNVKITSSFSNATAMYDAAPVQCVWENMDVQFTANSAYGLGIEYGEDCGMIDCRGYGAFTVRTILFNQCNSCWGVGVSGVMGVSGLGIETDGATVHGQNTIEDSDFTGNSLNGVLVTDGASENTFVGCYLGWNFYGANLGESGVSGVASNRTSFVSCQFVGNNTAAIVDDSIGNLFTNCWNEAQSAVGFAFQETGSAEFHGMRYSEMVLANFGGLFSCQGTGTVRVIGGSGQIGQANFHDFVTITGATIFSVADHTANRVGGGTGAFLDIADATAARVHVHGNVIAANFATALTVGTTATCRLSGASIAIGAIPNNGRFNRGSFVVNGAVAVPVAFLDTTANDRLFLTRRVAGAAPQEVTAGAPVAGTGFNPVGLAGDNGTMDYEIM